MTDSLVLSPGLSPELAAIASRVEAAMRADPAYRDMIHRWLADAGVAAAHDPVDDARLFAFLMTEEPQTDPEVLMSAFGELAGVVALAAGEHPVLPKWITHGVAAESAAVARMSTRMNL